MFDLWKLKDYDPGTGLAAGAHQPGFDDGDWIDIPAPGDVHRALMAAGRIPDPYYDRNEDQVAWMEEKEWWYRLTFDTAAEALAEDERLQLVFHGLDTFVTVYLNGAELGKHQNMFRPAVFDVSDKLKLGQPNTLALCFDRPLDYVDPDPPEEFKSLLWGRNQERIYMRKAQFGYGWDWGPRLPTIGIWRPVELLRQRQAAFRGVHFYTLEINEKENYALVAARAEIERFANDSELQVYYHLYHNGTDFHQDIFIPAGEESATAIFKITDPQLWWTHDLGEPVLHTLEAALMQEGDVFTETTQQVGIRTIALDQSPDYEERGTRFFRFVLNGVPIFAKGADWIPCDSFVGAIPDEQYRMLLTSAQQANMNMLRIWGGGLYEHDIFYDLCDQLGILVWQDFMFACAPYPEYDSTFVAEVEAEALYQVNRLRSRPCMALWNGNNENQWIHDRFNWDDPDNRVPGTLYYHEILPQVVAELDGQIPYWPGSPFGGSDHAGMEDGNRHNWEVWHGNSVRRFGEEPHNTLTPEGVSYRRYAEDMGRFISEFGMHASPVAETLWRVIPEDQRYHHSSSMDHHNKDNPKNKGDNLMLPVTGLPENIEEYIDFSMIAQAEGLKFGLEHFRRRKPHCSGTLFWQFDDCWPVLSWAVVDYYGFGKAGYYYAKRAYEPVLASFKELENGGVELWVTNDTLAPVEGQVIVANRKFNGETVRETGLTIEVPANASQMVVSWSAAELEAGPDHYLAVYSPDNLFTFNRHFFAAIKDLEHPAATIERTIKQVDEHTLEVELKANKYAYFVNLFIPEEGTIYSDNYFDLEAGAAHTIRITNAQVQLTPDTLTVRSR
ncbi:MAG: glycoside hydrolase family 2 protein [Anaerolineales bacterium]|nr:glycoside hydrolase family 2 protein [Anaerolineales bacterium]